MIALMIYLLSILGGIGVLLKGLTIAGCILSVIMTIIILVILGDLGSDIRNRDSAEWLCITKWCKRIGIGTIIAISLNILAPTEKTVAAMYLIPKLLENKEITGIPDKLLRLANVKMDEWIDDTVGAVGEGVDKVSTSIDKVANTVDSTVARIDKATQ